MSLRIVELIFRRKFLLILPIVLGGILGILLLNQSKEKTYLSQATVWVDQPANLGTAYNVTDFNQYLTLSQNEAMSMRELLATKSFRSGVLQKVDGFADPTDAESTDLLTNTYINPYGGHLVYVGYRSKDPERTALVTKTVIDEFGRIYAERIKAKADQLLNFYNDQVGVAQSAYEASSVALQGMIAGRPALANLDTKSQSIAVIANQDLGKAILSQDSAKAAYDAALERYTGAQITASSANSATSYFSVRDEPKVPEQPVKLRMRQALVMPMTGLFFGGLISAGLFLLWWRLDRKVRVPSDLAFVGRNIPVVSLPAVRKPWRRRWPDNFVCLAAAMKCDLRSS